MEREKKIRQGERESKEKNKALMQNHKMRGFCLPHISDDEIDYMLCQGLNSPYCG